MTKQEAEAEAISRAEAAIDQAKDDMARAKEYLKAGKPTQAHYSMWFVICALTRADLFMELVDD